MRITVFNEENLTGEYEVGTDGTISVPLLRSVQASGHTIDEVANAISTRLMEGGYVIEPRVSAEVLRYRPIFVLGEVNSPGEYEYSGNLNFLQAIAKAGGFTPRAKRSEIVLQRTGWETGRRISLSATPLIIAPGDTIIIEESFF